MRMLRNVAFVALLIGVMASQAKHVAASSDDACSVSCPTDTSSCCNVGTVQPVPCEPTESGVGWCNWCNNSGGRQSDIECSVYLPGTGTVYGTICQCESIPDGGR